MRNRYKRRISLLASFFLFWILLSIVSFANECPLQEFKQYVENLDKTEIESVDRLKNKYKKIASDQSSQCVSELFKDLIDYQ